MVKNLLFDCSDTLLHLHAKADLAAELGEPARAERIHNTFFGDPSVKSENNEAVKFINCYGRHGEEINI